MWNDKLVVVAGGSKGLGLQIAKAFRSEGAKAVLLARDEARLRVAVTDLNAQRDDSAFGYSIDLTSDDSRREKVERIVAEHGQIDVWVNAVGQSIRTSFQNASLADYRKLMEQNFFASVGASLDALPHLEKTSGNLINIGSLASKTGWPLVAPYVTSKHALAGFAHQIRLEGPPNVHYLFVCSGPIKSLENENRYKDQTEDLPENAAKPGAGAPVNAIDSEWLAKKIVEGCENSTTEIVIPLKSRLLFSLLQLWPKLGDRLIRKFCK